MNEKALQYAYELFQADGYADSLEDFKNLINTNSDAFNYSFELFQADGYQDSIDDFATLMGVKKKDNLDVVKPSLTGDTMVSDLEAGGLEQSRLEEEFRAEQDSINATGQILLDKQRELNSLKNQIEQREPNVVGQDIPVTNIEFEELNRLTSEVDSLETDLLQRQEKLDSLRFEIPDDVEIEIGKVEEGAYDPYETYGVENPRKSFMGRFKEFIPKTLEKIQGYMQSDAILGEEAVKKFNANTNRLISNISRTPISWAEFSNSITSMFYDAIEEQTGDLSRQELADYYGMEKLDKFSDNMLAAAEEIEESMLQFENSITQDLFSFNAKKVGQGLRRLGAEMVGAIPSLAVVLSSRFGFGAIGAGSAAGKSRELQDEGVPRSLNATRNAIGTGIAEGAFELVTRGLGRGAYKAMQGMTQREARSFLNTTLREFGKGFGLEGSSESTTLLTEKLLDASLLDDETAFNNLFYELADTFLIGGAVGGPLAGAPAGFGYIRNAREKANLNKVLEESKYDNLLDIFTAENFQIELDQIPIVNIPAAQKFLQLELIKQVENGDLTSEQAAEALLNFEEAISVLDGVQKLDLTSEQQTEAIPLLQRKRELQSLLEADNVDPELGVEYVNELAEINTQLQQIGSQTDTTISLEAEQKSRKQEDEQLEKVIQQILNPNASQDITLRQRRNVLQRAMERLEKLAPSELFDRVKEAANIDAKANNLQVRDYLELPGGVPRNINEEIEKVTPSNIIQLQGRVLRKLGDEKLTPEIRKKAFINLINNLQAKGKINSRSVKALIRRVNELDFNNPNKVAETYELIKDKFVKAETKTKFEEIASLLKSINRKITRKGLDPNVVEAVQEFLKINPNEVADLDAYINEAIKVDKGLARSKRRGTELFVGGAVNIADLQAYTKPELESAQERAIEIIEDTFEELTGLAPSEFSLSEMIDIVESLDTKKEDEVKKTLDNNEKYIRAAVKNAFEVYSTLIDKILKTGKDPFTGQPMNIDKDQKRLIKSFMEIDVTKLDSTKDALLALDALIQFATNGSTGGMGAVASTYVGSRSAELLKEEGVKATPINDVFSKLGIILNIGNLKLYKGWLENIGTFPMMIDNMFKGLTKGTDFMKKSFIQELFNKAAESETTSRNIAKEYNKEFYSKKPNGKSFNSSRNNIERGMYAFTRRNVMGTQAEQDIEFARRKKLVNKSIERLRENDDNARADVYQEIYDKILKDSNNAAEVESKVDAINKNAVQWMTDKWSEYYPQLRDINYNMYNALLDPDVFYTPDNISRFRTKQTPAITDRIFKSFEYVNNKLRNKQTGVLLENKRINSLDANQYVDLSFDSTNMRALTKALMNINTAETIFKVSGFLESKAFEEIVEDESDRRIVKERLASYVDDIRQQGQLPPGTNKLFNDAVRGFSKFGVVKALGSVGQFFKQLSPYASTLVTAGVTNASEGLTAFISNPDARKFLKNSGMAIVNRGVGQETILDDADVTLQEEALNPNTYTKTKKALNTLADRSLEYLLKYPDAVTAQASWLAFYIQNMKQQGNIEIGSPTFDWANHKLNQDAADYAQRQVDRQQNTSDQKLQGAWYRDRSPTTRALIAVFLPFSNFLLNLKTRMYTDWNVVLGEASKEDKIIAARSLAGIKTEMLMFNAMSIFIANGMKEIAYALTDFEDEEKKKENYDNYLKSRMGTMAVDLFSPMPVSDYYVLEGLNFVMRNILKNEEDPFQFYNTPRELETDLGTITVGPSEVVKMFESLSNLMNDGVITRGDEEYILSDEEKRLIALVGAAKVLYVLGAPAELGRIGDQINKILEDRFTEPSTRFKRMPARTRRELGLD